MSDIWTGVSVEPSNTVSTVGINEAVTLLSAYAEHPRFFWLPIDPAIAIRRARAMDMRLRRPLRAHRRAMQHLALQRRYGSSHEQRMARRMADYA